MRYDLKTWPEFFKPILEGVKNFELRKDDRGYKVGDILNLKEWTKSEEYTGRIIIAEVTYILSGLGLKPGWVILSFRKFRL